MTLPNFLVVGANKSGTTSLWHYLDQHPDIFMSPIKETNFFVSEVATPSKVSVSDLDEYRNLFQKGKKHAARGEISPAYLTYYETAVENIKSLIPDAKIVIILRNPVERVYSGYYHAVRGNSEDRTFHEALEQGEYIDKGMASEKIRHYLDHFDDDQVLIQFFDDLKNDLQSLLEELHEFLGVEHRMPEETQPMNKSGEVNYRLVHNLIKSGNLLVRFFKLPFKLIPKQKRRALREFLLRKNLKEKPPMPDEIKQELKSYYKDEIKEIESITGRNLTHWYQSDE